MSTADHAVSDRPASDIAGELASAEFVRFVTAPDGDALAATGVLARRLSTPFKARVGRTGAAGVSDSGLTVAVGDAVGDSDLTITGRPLAVRAVEIAQTLEDTTLPPELRALALAGIIAAEKEIDDHTDAFERELDIDSRPGVGVPTTDLVDGLAHTTLAHAPFSGDVDATANALSDSNDANDAETRVRTASMLAVSVVDEPNTNASTAIERALSPRVIEPADSCSFATLAGYADVLDALARSAPGEGLALALGYGNTDTALARWREHAKTVHAAVRAADLDQCPDCVVAQLPDTPLLTAESAARLIREYRSPEPVVLGITDDAVVATTRTNQDITDPLTEAVCGTDSTATVAGCGRYARAAIDPEDAVVTAFQEAI